VLPLSEVISSSMILLHSWVIAMSKCSYAAGHTPANSLPESVTLHILFKRFASVVTIAQKQELSDRTILKNI
jgi:hypothetical protein